jgi:hypothetical protein
MDIDPKFYKNNYLDIREFNEEELKSHFIKYGFWEGRIGSQEMLNDRIKKNDKIVEKRNKVLDDFNYKKGNEELINILIRTSKRPKAFKININSILSQNYKNLKLLISYDNEETLNYINNILKDLELDYNLFEVQKTKEYYSYNDYCNTLLANVKDGYIIFLDDDDKFLHNNALKYINEHLLEDRFLAWEYQRPDKIIGPKKGDIKKGNITSCGFCYHSKFKSFWPSLIGSDYEFVKNLVNKNPIKLAKINKVLTASIIFSRIYGEGKCLDLE